MKVGDLVEKVKGYNPKERNFTGIVVGIVVERATSLKKAKVWSCDGEIESWIVELCEVINESR